MNHLERREKMQIGGTNNVKIYSKICSPRLIVLSKIWLCHRLKGNVRAELAFRAFRVPHGSTFRRSRTRAEVFCVVRRETKSSSGSLSKRATVEITRRIRVEAKFFGFLQLCVCSACLALVLSRGENKKKTHKKWFVRKKNWKRKEFRLSEELKRSAAKMKSFLMVVALLSPLITCDVTVPNEKYQRSNLPASDSLYCNDLNPQSHLDFSMVKQKNDSRWFTIATLNQLCGKFS